MNTPETDTTGGADLEQRTPRFSTGRLMLLTSLAALAVFLVPKLPLVGPLFAPLCWLVFLSLASWLSVRLLRRLLWRVSRRLAVSYLLIGVLPIPMVAMLVLVGFYLLGGFFLTHQTRSALRAVQGEVETVAALTADAYVIDDARLASPFADISVAYYQDGRRVYGSHTAPETWPSWLVAEDPGASRHSRRRTPRLVAFRDGASTLVAAQEIGNRGVLAYFDGDLARDVARRADAWLEMVSKDDPRNEAATHFQLGNNEWTFQPLRRAEARGNVDDFFEERGLPSDPLVIGLDTLGPLYALEDGAVLSENVSATVFAPPQAIFRSFFAGAREIDTLGWVAFIIPAFLLFAIYVIAAVMAIFLIAGLSRAVNQLSGATNRVQAGDFRARIEVRRRDQLGALHHSFNQMTESLERAVAEATQKELIDKELEIARDLQRSLLPVQLQLGDRIEVASFFEPSAAIGGDYYDIVPLNDERSRLAVAIADVSGHGLPAGLRTAMLKAGLEILIRERTEADEIFHSLDRIVRSGTERTFVTATLTVLDLDAGTATITNAGHCPTYLLSANDRSVQEIVLPGTPLGALRQRYGHLNAEISEGDCLVWLSDGLIEAENAEGDVFGYERIVETLETLWSGGTTPTEFDGIDGAAVRDALVNAVHHWCGSEPAADDRTLVVLRCAAERDAEMELEGVE